MAKTYSRGNFDITLIEKSFKFNWKCFLYYFSALIIWKAPNKEYIVENPFVIGSEKSRAYSST